MKELETRTISTSIRALPVDGDSAGARSIEGYALRFGESSLPLADWFSEFTEELSRDVRIQYEQDDLFALWNHDSGQVIGRKSAGTLTETRDEDGLKVRIDLPDTQAGRDAYELVQRGDVGGMSFGFRVVDEDVDLDRDVPHRTVTDIILREVSVTPFPAYPTTDVEVARSRILGAQNSQTRQDDSAAPLKQETEDGEEMETNTSERGEEIGEEQPEASLAQRQAKLRAQVALIQAQER